MINSPDVNRRGDCVRAGFCGSNFACGARKRRECRLQHWRSLPSERAHRKNVATSPRPLVSSSRPRSSVSQGDFDRWTLSAASSSPEKQCSARRFVRGVPSLVWWRLSWAARCHRPRRSQRGSTSRTTRLQRVQQVSSRTSHGQAGASSAAAFPSTPVLAVCAPCNRSIRRVAALREEHSWAFNPRRCRQGTRLKGRRAAMYQS
jgi:hypothetical protein